MARFAGRQFGWADAVEFRDQPLYLCEHPRPFHLGNAVYKKSSHGVGDLLTGLSARIADYQRETSESGPSQDMASVTHRRHRLTHEKPEHPAVQHAKQIEGIDLSLIGLEHKCPGMAEIPPLAVDREVATRTDEL
jgi:hypothetical protein